MKTNRKTEQKRRKKLRDKQLLNQLLAISTQTQLRKLEQIVDNEDQILTVCFSDPSLTISTIHSINEVRKNLLKTFKG